MNTPSTPGSDASKPKPTPPAGSPATPAPAAAAPPEVPAPLGPQGSVDDQGSVEDQRAFHRSAAAPADTAKPAGSNPNQPGTPHGAGGQSDTPGKDPAPASKPSPAKGAAVDEAAKNVPLGSTARAIKEARDTTKQIKAAQKAIQNPELSEGEKKEKQDALKSLKKERNEARQKVVEEAGKEVAEKFGVPKEASDKVIKTAKRLWPFIVAAILVIVVLLLVLVLVISGASKPQKTSAKVTETVGARVTSEQRQAAEAYNVPEGILQGLSLVATETGKFSPYPDDTVDRNPQRVGIRRPSAGAGTSFVGNNTDVTPTTVADASAVGPVPTPAAPGGKTVAVVGDSLCEPVVEPVYRKALEGAGNTVASFDCVRSRPLAGDGVKAVTAAAGTGTVLVSLGTNDLPNNKPGAFAANVEGLLAANPSANFVWFNFASSLYGAASTSYNAELARIATANPRLVIADIAAGVAANPGFQAEDRLHLTGPGQEERARLGASAVSGAATTPSTTSVGVWPPNPAGMKVSDYPVVTPAIGGEGKASGPYLIRPSVLRDYPDLKMQDFRFSGRRNVVTATDFVARQLSKIRDDLVADGWVDDQNDPDTQRRLWTEVVTRLGVSVQDPRQVTCTVPDMGPPDGDPALNQVRNAQLISQIWFCEISNAAEFHTLVGVTKKGDKWSDKLEKYDAAALVVKEAAQVSWSFSNWGTTACDASASEAGLFPLTQTVFDTYAPPEDKSKGRCDVTANARAAVRAFIAGEQVQPGARVGDSGAVGDRTDAQGPYAPMLGGWRAMPSALGGPAGIEDFAKNGPAATWIPDRICTGEVDLWISAAAGDTTYATGTKALDGLPVCDSPGGGGLQDPLWVAEFRARVTTARDSVKNASTNPDAESGVTDPSGTSLGQSGGVTAEMLAQQVSNLDGVLTSLGPVADAAAAVPALTRVTHTGAAPADMPMFVLTAAAPQKLENASETTAVAGADTSKSSYAALVTQVAENIGGLVPGWYGENRTQTEPETLQAVVQALAPLKAYAIATPGGSGAGGANLGDEIPYAAIFNAKGAQYSIDPRFLASVAWAESGYSDENVYCTNKSRAGALGLMQFMPATARSFNIDPCVPEQAVDGAARFYGQLYKKYNAWDLSLAAYNAGPGRVNPCMCVPAIKETRAYVAKILQHWEELKVKYPDQLPVGAPPLPGGAFISGGAIPGGRMVETFNRGPMCVVKIPAGITVNCEIGSAVQQLVTDAASQGVNMGGGAYRDYQGQLAVRRNNCGTSNYAVYEMPSGSCSPPTARPGTSQHELGLAIDFTCSGSHFTSRSGPCWNFLAANASRYGLINFPREPWHWSTTGR